MHAVPEEFLRMNSVHAIIIRNGIFVKGMDFHWGTPNINIRCWCLVNGSIDKNQPVRKTIKITENVSIRGHADATHFIAVQ